MNAKALIGTVIETIIKVLVLAAAIILVFKGATKAYDFGYRVFADEPMSITGGRTITVGIAEDADIKDIAKMLEEKGLISDYRLFVVQELLSSGPGRSRDACSGCPVYRRCGEEMLEILAGEGEEGNSNTVAPNAETGDATDQSEEEITPEESGNEDMEAEVLPEDTAESSELTETGE